MIFRHIYVTIKEKDGETLKKLLCIMLAIIFSLSGLNLVVFAETLDFNASISVLRAGGGENGGGGGSSGGGSNGGSNSGGSVGGYGTNSRGNRRTSLLETILQIVLFPFIFFSSAIVFHFQLSKRSRKAKKLIKHMQKSDHAWKFNNLQKCVEESFYAIQNAWTNLDMLPASQYMSDQLYDRFQTDLNWMKIRHEKNILKNIKLIEALPVAVYDDADDNCDHVWFYISGKMIDYTIDTQTGEKLSGKTASSKFVEYWQFIRKDDVWVLNKILQKDESDQIAFSA